MSITFQPIEKNVLITGCSSGIGRATAHVLRDRGWHVFPTARRADDLADLRHSGFEPIALDVADSESISRAVDSVIALSNGTLGAVVNNAGVAQFGAVEDLTRDAVRHQFEVNTFGALDLTNRLIPHFRANGRGRIVNVSSVYGRVTAPMVGCYCASKYAMEAFSDAMRIELRSEGVAVSLIEPGPIYSAFRSKSADHSVKAIDMQVGRYGNRYQCRMAKAKAGQRKDFFTRPPEAVAEKIAHALESAHPHSRYCVTVPAYIGAFLRRFAPDSLLDLMLSKSARM